MGQQQAAGNTAEYKALKLRIMTLIFSIVSHRPERLELLGIDKELLECLELARMLKSSAQEETELATNFSLLLLNHDETVTTSDLVGFDLESRDVLTKTEMKKVWQALNSIGSKEVTEIIGSAVAVPKQVDPDKLKKQILTELNKEFKEAIQKDVVEMVKKNLPKQSSGEGEVKFDATELEEKLNEHIEETKKASSDLKVQVLKVATALKVANMSLKAQGEQITEIKTSPRAGGNSASPSPRKQSPGGEDSEEDNPLMA